MPDDNQSVSLDPPPTRSGFRAAGVDEIVDFISTMYVDNRVAFRRAPAAATFSAATADVPGLGADQIRTTVDYDVDTAGVEDHFISFLVEEGTAKLQRLRHENLLRVGDSTFYPPGVEQRFAVDGLAVRTLRIPMARIRDVADEIADAPGHTLRFDTAAVPVSAPMAAYWRAQVRFVTAAMHAPQSPLTSPLLREETIRTVALAALHVFANTTMTPAHVRGPGWVEPAALRRAVAYIEAHAHEPVTIADIAAAAGTAPRAIQYAFRRHRSTTPLAYQRQVRLERAHRDLLAADPSQGDTVHAIATRWGFAQPSRFAATYAAAYDQPPSHTLRQ